MSQLYLDLLVVSNFHLIQPCPCNRHLLIDISYSAFQWHCRFSLLCYWWHPADSGILFPELSIVPYDGSDSLTWVCVPSNRVIARNIKDDLNFPSRRGKTAKDTCTSTISPIWNWIGEIATNLRCKLVLINWKGSNTQTYVLYPSSPAVAQSNKLDCPQYTHMYFLLLGLDFREGQYRR